MFNNPSMLSCMIYWLIFSNSLSIIKTDRNMSEIWQIVCKKCNFNVDALFVLLCELFINRRTWIYYIEIENFPVCGFINYILHICIWMKLVLNTQRSRFMYVLFQQKEDSEFSVPFLQFVTNSTSMCYLNVTIVVK